MKDKEFVIEQKLRDIYYDPGAGFQSAERLYQKARNDGLDVSRGIVKEWLKTQDTYTRHKPIVRKHKFQRTFVKYVADQIQMDLVDMGKYKTRTKDTIGFLQSFKFLNHYDFVALHSMWIIFLKVYCVLVRVEIIHKSKFLPGTAEKVHQL